MDADDSRNKRSPPPPGYRGRFAPSPTGPLHFGSLVAAVGSHLQARARRGLWLVRIENIDPPREVAGAARAQIETLARFGMRADAPVTFQSDSSPLHAAAIEKLKASGRAFDCGCSRRDLPDSGIYPGTCRHGLRRGRTARSIRFRVGAEPVRVDDRVFGVSEHDLESECGDFVIRRADGLVAYQLAVTVDDHAAGITEVVRGRDLLESSARQQALYVALGLPVPEWMHLPLVVDRKGRKLSKSAGDDPVESRQSAATLRLALTALGHEPPVGARALDTIWRWAHAEWRPARIPTEPFEAP
ncbi:MAG: tRNA glutamyl-Q(34) synthetase GluQRS [Candidatus Wenzhouxiangella sp. M2_3B_020]